MILPVKYPRDKYCQNARTVRPGTEKPNFLSYIDSGAEVSEGIPVGRDIIE